MAGSERLAGDVAAFQERVDRRTIDVAAFQASVKSSTAFIDELDEEIDEARRQLREIGARSGGRGSINSVSAPRDGVSRRFPPARRVDVPAAKAPETPASPTADMPSSQELAPSIRPLRRPELEDRITGTPPRPVRE
jgi:hypothetical protein